MVASRLMTCPTARVVIDDMEQRGRSKWTRLKGNGHALEPLAADTGGVLGKEGLKPV